MTLTLVNAVVRTGDGCWALITAAASSESRDAIVVRMGEVV
jgi:hypothetical protein